MQPSVDELCWAERLLTVLREANAQNPTVGQPGTRSLPSKTPDGVDGCCPCLLPLRLTRKRQPGASYGDFVLFDQRETLLFGLASRFSFLFYSACGNL